VQEITGPDNKPFHLNRDSDSRYAKVGMARHDSACKIVEFHGSHFGNIPHGAPSYEANCTEAAENGCHDFATMGSIVTAKLTAEVRRAGEIRKPCLVELERLFEVALGDMTPPGSPIALTIAYADLGSRRYKSEYSVQYRRGINECLMEFKKLDLVG
jgi:hypothetical protein